MGVELNHCTATVLLALTNRQRATQQGRCKALFFVPGVIPCKPSGSLLYPHAKGRGAKRFSSIRSRVL